MYVLPRTGSRGDGLGCFVKEGIAVLDRQASSRGRRPLVNPTVNARPGQSKIIKGQCRSGVCARAYVCLCLCLCFVRPCFFFFFSHACLLGSDVVRSVMMMAGGVVTHGRGA